ncbi:glycoside hydrolase family 76 protein [Amycolatopsis palatopharyngis]|uniref:glycoside hydrolase family 76 protein n=1 Tax=Amycolatopsis palatopharyngis TaxID=187982 RepID=UPI000E23B419|nr:glycoside hydrolase family 76 protein [Amycolatopsis palatopharyngis]
MEHVERTISRRSLIAGSAAVTAGLVAAPAAQASGRAAGSQGGGHGVYAQRAQESYAALQRYFYDPAHSLYLEEYPRSGGNPWSYVWPFSQAMIATQVMAGIPVVGDRFTGAVADRYRALELYWNGGTEPPGYDSYVRPPLGHGGDKFYDDNEWNALGLIQRHYMTDGGDQAALDRAAEIFDLVVFGWDTDPNHPCPGGVFWTQADWSSDRNTVSNGPGAEVGLHLYLITGDEYYLDWASRMYEWVRGCLLAPNGLYWDNIRLDGSIWEAQFSYNQGVMIGAGVLLYRATGAKQYLDQARATAAAALSHYAEDERYFTQPARFHAILFSNLLQLDVIVHDPAYRAAMDWYATRSRDRFLDTETGLYRFTGSDPVQLLEQAGMIRIEGMLAWRSRDYPKLT